MRLRRSSAPSSPGFLHASASARICRFSLAENRRRFAVATTSGSGAGPLRGPPLRSPFGLPAGQPPHQNSSVCRSRKSRSHCRSCLHLPVL